MKASTRALASILIAPFLSTIACGLPKTIFLSQPGFSSTGAYQFVLTHNVDNYDASEGVNQSFKGYEIYYRAYDSELAAQSAVLTLQNNKTNYESSPNQFMNSAESLGFVRMKNKSTSVKPLISIINAPGSVSTATLDIKINSDWVITTTDPNPDESFPVVRSISDSLRNSFYNNANYLSTDTMDFSGSSTPTTVFFVFFAVAYGDDPESIGQEIYGLPDDMIASLAPTGNIISLP